MIGGYRYLDGDKITLYNETGAPTSSEDSADFITKDLGLVNAMQAEPGILGVNWSLMAHYLSTAVLDSGEHMSDALSSMTSWVTAVWTEEDHAAYAKAVAQFRWADSPLGAADWDPRVTEGSIDLHEGGRAILIGGLFGTIIMKIPGLMQAGGSLIGTQMKNLKIQARHTDVMGSLKELSSQVGNLNEGREPPGFSGPTGANTEQALRSLVSGLSKDRVAPLLHFLEHSPEWGLETEH